MVTSKQLSYVSYDNSTIKHSFLCDCGSIRLYRPKKQYNHTFFEGFFICVECKKHHNYYSDSFKVINDKITQLSLF